MKIIISKTQLENILKEAENKFKIPQEILDAHQQVEKKYGLQIEAYYLGYFGRP